MQQSGFGKIARWLAKGFVALALGGCAETGADDDDELTSEVSDALGAGAPIFVHGSFVQKPGGGPDGARTAALRVPGALNVLVTTQERSEPELRAWKAGGRGVLAKHVPMKTVLDALEAGRDPLAGLLASWDLVAIDELEDSHLEPGKAARIRDGRPLAKKFADLLAKHPGRVILYVNTYNMAGAPRDSRFNELRSFRQALTACGTHCLALASQMYLSTGEAFPPNRGVASKTGCANGLRCHGWSTRLLLAAAPNLRGKIVQVLDVRERTNGGVVLKPASDARSFCAPGAGGALQREMAKARALGLRGVGTYALPYVSPSAANVSRLTSCFRRSAAFFTTKRGLAPSSVTEALAPLSYESASPDDAALFTDPEIATDLDPDVAP